MKMNVVQPKRRTFKFNSLRKFKLNMNYKWDRYPIYQPYQPLLIKSMYYNNTIYNYKQPILNKKNYINIE